MAVFMGVEMYRFNSRRCAVIGALLVSVVATGASAQNYRQTVATTAPVASFQLDAPNTSSTNGTYTTTWQNVSSGAGAPIAWATGNAGALFDGTGATSVIDTSLTGMTPGRGSIVAWINAAMLPSAAGRVFDIAGESQFANDFDFQFDQDNMLSFCIGAGECLRSAVGNGFVDSWHMVTAAYNATRSGGLDTQSIYLDGALFMTRTGSFSDASHSSAFTIGYSSVFGGREFGGLIDEVSVYDRELAATEIAGLYAARNVSGEPVAVVPEPATWTMMMLGLGMIGAAMRRRRRAIHRLV